MALDDVIDVKVHLDGEDIGKTFLIGIDASDMFFTDIKGDIYVRHNQTKEDLFKMYDSVGNHYLILPAEGRDLFYQENAMMAETGKNQLREMLKGNSRAYASNAN